MTKSREQQAADKKVEAARKKALVAFANCDAAQDDFMKADVAAKNAKDIAREAKSDARKADAVYFEAVKSSLAIDKAAYVAGKKGLPKRAPRTVDQTPPLPLPTVDDVYQDDGGYATDAAGYPFLTPEGESISVADMFRKIEAQDWSA